MYLYQLMLSKEWQQVQSSKSQNQHYSSVLKTKRIKHFYDNDYDGIVNYLVANPNSCKNFYATLQQVGLSYQSYYEKMPDHVATVLKATLFNEKVVLIELPPQGGYYEESLLRNPLITSSVTNQDPVYESDDAWLIVDLLNHQPELIDIRDPAAINTTVTNAKTGPDQIFLKHSNSMSPHQVLPKVHILLGGKQGDYNLATRGEKSLRVKKLAQQWLDELSTLLQSGNSPFSVEQDEALASLINYGYSPTQNPDIKVLDDNHCFRPDERIGALFYQLLLTLNSTDFIVAKQRIGDLAADEGEGAIPDEKQLKRTINTLSNLRHSEGYDTEDYAYTSSELANTAATYLTQPLITDGTGKIDDHERKLKAQIAHYTVADELMVIEILYFNAIKLMKLLRQPGMIRHVVTRQEYKLKATKLTYRNIELKQLDVIHLTLNKNYKYKITSEDGAHQLSGRYDMADQLHVKIPAKWSSVANWNVQSDVVEVDFIDKYFPKLNNLTFTLDDAKNTGVGLLMGGGVGAITGYLFGDQIKETVVENLPRIMGGLQVAGGVASLYVAGALGATGIGIPLAAVISFVAIDNIQAGLRTVVTNDFTATYGGALIESTGLLPKGYGEIAYSVVDIGTITKAGILLKTSTQMTNIVKFSAASELKAGQAIKPQQVRISVEKITLNEPNKIALKELDVSKPAAKDAILKNTDTIPQIVKNARQGKLYEQQQFLNLKNQYPNAVEQITIKTNNDTKFRIDAMASDPVTGKLILEEYKSSLLAPLTKNQKIGFPELTQSGGRIIGKGKGVFVGGTKIPPEVDIQIIRPPK